MGRLVFENGKPVVHRTWFKVVLNPILRHAQFWTDRPYVIVSKVVDREVVGYGFRRMRLAKESDLSAES